MLADRETLLDSIEKQKYEIPLDREAYLFEFDKIIEERCDEFDYELESEGYIVVFQEMIPVAVSIFNYRVIGYR